MKRTVICISIRESMPEQIKVGEKYKIDLEAAYGDHEGDWFVPVYNLNDEKISDLKLSHFRDE